MSLQDTLDRIAASLAARNISKAAVGRALGMTGQAITQKLQGKRPIEAEEMKVMAELAGMTLAEAMGDDAVVIDAGDEQDLVKLYRMMTDEQRARMLGNAWDVAGEKLKAKEADNGAD